MIADKEEAAKETAESEAQPTAFGYSAVSLADRLRDIADEIESAG